MPLLHCNVCRSEFHRRQPSIHLDMVHYVVPAPSSQPDGGTGRPGRGTSGTPPSKDIKMYVSTGDGLKEVVKAKKRISFDEDKMREKGAVDSVDEDELPPPPLPRKPAIQDPMANTARGFLDTQPPTSPSQSSERSDNSLGAIPKKRVSHHQANKGTKCGREAVTGSSPISNSSSSATSISR